MQLEKVKELAKKIYKQTKSVATTGHILRDVHGLYDFKKNYNLNLAQIIQPVLPDNLLHMLYNYLTYRKHIDKHARDKHNRKKNHEFVSKINKAIKELYRRQGLVFEWSIDNLESRLNRLWLN